MLNKTMYYYVIRIIFARMPNDSLKKILLNRIVPGIFCMYERHLIIINMYFLYLDQSIFIWETGFFLILTLT